MLALRAHEGSKSLHLDNVEIPKPGPVDVVVKVAAAGLAPGVFTIFDRGITSRLPTTLGHEAAGTIFAVGSALEGVTIGERVRVHPSLSCGTCGFCKEGNDHLCIESALIGFQGFGKGPMPLYDVYHNGGLAEYIRIPYRLVDKLPDNVSFDVGAKVQDVASCLHTLKMAALRPGATVIITAATGTMGTATVKMAKLFGIGRLLLIGRSSERLRDVAKLTTISCEIVALSELGADWPTSKSLVRKLRQICPEGVDAIIDYMPSGADIWQVLGGLAVNGTMVHMGGNASVLPLPMVAIMANCWKIVGTRGNTRTDAHEVLEWLKNGTLNVDDLVTHRFKLRDILEAVPVFRNREQPIWMAVVNP